MDSKVEVRLAREEDIPGILRLQQAHYVLNLSPTEREQNGFIGILAPEPALKEIIPTGNVLVACLDQRVLGQIILPTIEQSRLFGQDPVVIHERLSQLQFEGHPLTSYRIIHCLQLVIDRDHRRQGIHDLLLKGARTFFSDRYDLLISEISLLNTRSVRVHLSKKRLHVVMQYESERGEEGHDWYIIVYDLRPASS
jgi:hypothetical protein